MQPYPPVPHEGKGSPSGARAPTGEHKPPYPGWPQESWPAGEPAGYGSQPHVQPQHTVLGIPVPQTMTNLAGSNSNGGCSLLFLPLKIMDPTFYQRDLLFLAVCLVTCVLP